MKLKLLGFSFFIMMLVWACNSTSEETQNADNNQQEEAIGNNSSTSSSLNRYEIKSGLVTYDMEMMGITANVKNYFDNYGEMEATVVKSNFNFLGKSTDSEMRTIYKDNFLYSLDLLTKTGTKMKVEDGMNFRHFNINKITQEQKTAYNFKELGTEEVAGKKCKVYSMQVDGNTSKVWLWKNITVKVMAVTEEGEFEFEASSIEETSDIPAGIFDIPADYTISDMGEINEAIDDMYDKAEKANK